MHAIRFPAQILRRHWGWLKWLVAVAVLAWLFQQHGDGLRRIDWRQVRWQYLALALVLNTAAMLVTYLRWYLLVWAQEFPFRVSDAIRLGMIGYLFNYVAPGAVGGDLVKGSLIAREQKSRRTVAVATVLLDRLVGMLGLLLVGSAAVLVPTTIVADPRFQVIIVGFWAGTAVGVAGMIIALLPAITRWPLLNRLVHVRIVGPIAGQMLNAVRLYQARWRVLVAAVLVSCVSHLGIIAAFYFCAVALYPGHVVPGLLAHMQFIPAAELFGVVVPLPAGTGALEGATAYFFEMAGARSEDGFITAIAYRGLSVLIAVLGGGYYLTNRREVDEALHDADVLPAEPAADADRSVERMARV
jgi:uncharacterized protein (TIRG00374 family)